ncbi:hypothetical protein H5410_037308 [Solanum commersonii]|uniref:Uncharacterized protein n=1 Tax=Solanum commersonii TaxID=4109 RepID=A0A9J5Y9U5_SOLCO|nr:hypothetical protein H5410_037308 [Solanum commersonii]
MKDIMDNSSGKVTPAKNFFLNSSTHQNVVATILLAVIRVLAAGVFLLLDLWVEDVLARCKETLDNIKTDDAIFASLRLRKYVEPSPMISKNRTTPRMNHDPSRNIGMIFLPRTEEENAHFVELGAKESIRDETYLVIFLACWLCKLALPNKKVDCICASVFKVASLMAYGKIFSLAVSVLASICRGLRNISTSSNLGACDILLPIHNVYVSILRPTTMLPAPNEPYSPHRFSRQFGYCQDVPGALIKHHYDGSLLVLVQLWNSCVHLGSSSKIIIPMRPSNKGSLMTCEYSDWWPSHREILLTQVST